MMETDLLRVASEFQAFLSDYAKMRDEREKIQRKVVELEMNLTKYRKEHITQVEAVQRLTHAMRQTVAEIHQRPNYRKPEKLSEHTRTQLNMLRHYLNQLP